MTPFISLGIRTPRYNFRLSCDDATIERSSDGKYVFLAPDRIRVLWDRRESLFHATMDEFDDLMRQEMEKVPV